MKTLKVGDKVPNFTALDQDGNSISLSDYQGKQIIDYFCLKSANDQGVFKIDFIGVSPAFYNYLCNGVLPCRRSIWVWCTDYRYPGSLYIDDLFYNCYHSHHCGFIDEIFRTCAES